jgi:maltose O-acetyltransferase
MTEREKMLAGALYDASDPELVRLRKRARALMRAYNASTEEQPDERQRLIRALFGRVGARAEIEPPFYCDYGAHIFAGDRLYMNFGCVVLDPNEVHLGDNVFLGPRVQILTATHPLEAAERIRGPELGYPVRIGNNVWIGGGAIICPGVTIGDDTTVGAGSVVVKDLPARVLAVGNPCRVVRTLAEAPRIEPKEQTKEPEQCLRCGADMAEQDQVCGACGWTYSGNWEPPHED